ncbi:MAG: ribonuclease P protein component [Nevskia sp.]|nr:ribonuclease P protein component [Nevskia sp.]
MAGGARLQRRARIRRPAEFKQVFARGFRVRQPPLGVVCTPNGLDGPRLGLALARKSVPLAVARNRIKRLIREEFRHNQQRLPAADLVFYGLPGLNEAGTAQLRAALAEIWLKVIDRCARSCSESSARTSAC